MSAERKEWIRARHSPGRPTRVTVTVLEENISCAWTVEEFDRKRLGAAANQARRDALAGLSQLQEATNEEES